MNKKSNQLKQYIDNQLILFPERVLLPIFTTTTPNISPTANIIAFYAYLSATISSISGQSTLTFDILKPIMGTVIIHQQGCSQLKRPGFMYSHGL